MSANCYKDVSASVAACHAFMLPLGKRVTASENLATLLRTKAPQTSSPSARAASPERTQAAVADTRFQNAADFVNATVKHNNATALGIKVEEHMDIPALSGGEDCGDVVTVTPSLHRSLTFELVRLLLGFTNDENRGHRSLLARAGLIWPSLRQHLTVGIPAPRQPGAGSSPLNTGTGGGSSRAVGDGIGAIVLGSYLVQLIRETFALDVDFTDGANASGRIQFDATSRDIERILTDFLNWGVLREVRSSSSSAASPGDDFTENNATTGSTTGPNMLFKPSNSYQVDGRSLEDIYSEDCRWIAKSGAVIIMEDREEEVFVGYASGVRNIIQGELIGGTQQPMPADAFRQTVWHAEWQEESRINLIKSGDSTLATVTLSTGSPTFKRGPEGKSKDFPINMTVSFLREEYSDDLVRAVMTNVLAALEMRFGDLGEAFGRTCIQPQRYHLCLEIGLAVERVLALRRLPSAHPSRLVSTPCLQRDTYYPIAQASAILLRQFHARHYLFSFKHRLLHCNYYPRLAEALHSWCHLATVENILGEDGALLSSSANPPLNSGASPGSPSPRTSTRAATKEPSVNTPPRPTRTFSESASPAGRDQSGATRFAPMHDHTTGVYSDPTERKEEILAHQGNLTSRSLTFPPRGMSVDEMLGEPNRCVPALRQAIIMRVGFALAAWFIPGEDREMWDRVVAAFPAYQALATARGATDMNSSRRLNNSSLASNAADVLIPSDCEHFLDLLMRVWTHLATLSSMFNHGARTIKDPRAPVFPDRTGLPAILPDDIPRSLRPNSDNTNNAYFFSFDEASGTVRSVMPTVEREYRTFRESIKESCALFNAIRSQPENVTDGGFTTAKFSTASRSKRHDVVMLRKAPERYESVDGNKDSKEKPIGGAVSVAFENCGQQRFAMTTNASASMNSALDLLRIEVEN